MGGLRNALRTKQLPGSEFRHPSEKAPHRHPPAYLANMLCKLIGRSSERHVHRWSRRKRYRRGHFLQLRGMRHRLCSTPGWIDKLNNPQKLRAAGPDQQVVLLAEDDVTVQNVARIALERDRLLVLTASDGEDALTIANEFPGDIVALLTDVKMPRLDGLELTRRIFESRPSIRVIIMSGQVEDPLLAGVSFLPKPTPAVLRQRVSELLSVPLSAA